MHLQSAALHGTGGQLKGAGPACQLLILSKDKSMLILAAMAAL